MIFNAIFVHLYQIESAFNFNEPRWESAEDRSLPDMLRAITNMKYNNNNHKVLIMKSLAKRHRILLLNEFVLLFITLKSDDGHGKTKSEHFQ